MLTLGALLVPFVAVLGYLYGAHALYRVQAFSLRGRAHRCSVSVARRWRAVRAALIARSSSELLSANNGGSWPAASCPSRSRFPSSSGGLRLQGQHHGLYGTEVGVALFVTPNAFIFSRLVWFTARAESRRCGSAHGGLPAPCGAAREPSRVGARWSKPPHRSCGRQMRWACRSTIHLRGARSPDSRHEKRVRHPFEAIHPDDRARVLVDWQRAVAARTPTERDTACVTMSGEWRWTSVRAVPLRSADGSVTSWVGMNIDITERKRAHSLAEGQKRVLEMIARDAPLRRDARSAHAAHRLTVRGHVVVDPAAGCGRQAFAPRRRAAPAGRVHQRHRRRGHRPDRRVVRNGGIHRANPCIVEDIETDPLWADFKHLALPHGLRACWSTPILDSERQRVRHVRHLLHAPGAADRRAHRADRPGHADGGHLPHAPSRDGASQAHGGIAAALAEARSAGHALRRHRARLQQHAARHRRQCASSPRTC